MYAVELMDISKTFPNGVRACNGINLSLKKGEIRSIVGENGAGKTTLMNILYGIHRPDKGTIAVNGETVQIQNPKHAISLGIGMIHQHFKLVPQYTIAENIVLGKEPVKGPFISRDKARRITEEISGKYGLPVDPNLKIENASVGIQQRTEILKALYRSAEVLILDEPTAVLTPQETDELFVILRNLSKQGKSILFISHKLEEVLKISDSITVIRGGEVIANLDAKKTSYSEIAFHMVGREVLLKVVKDAAIPKEPVLKVESLRAADDRGMVKVMDVSLEVKAGEILGVAGIEGNGQVEFVESVTGLRKPLSGRVFIDGVQLKSLDVKGARKGGLSFIPEDRNSTGLSPQSPIWENLVLGAHWDKPFAENGMLRINEIKLMAAETIKRFSVKASGVNAPAYSLSGGNQQKLVVARELGRKTKLMIAAQPTRGVDIGAIEFIHRQIIDARDKGMAVLLISSELQEIMSLSDRIVVFYSGSIVGEVKPSDVTEHDIGIMMLGKAQQERVVGR